MLTLHITKPALKTLRKLPAGIATRIRRELDLIAANPAAYRGDWKPLQDEANVSRLRVGDWRVLCELQHGELRLLVIKIAARGDAYK